MKSKPRPGDLVFQQSRLDLDLYPHGEIVNIHRDRECEDLSEVTVVFKKPARLPQAGCILLYNNETHWSIVGKYVLINGEDPEEINHNLWSYSKIEDGQSTSEEVSIETIPLSDFDGYWSSHSGGSGSWEIP